MNRLIKGVLVFVLCLLFLAGIYILYKIVFITGASQAVNQNLATGDTTLEILLSQSEIVRAIPSGATILLRTYNFDSGTREWESSYLLTKNGAVKTTSDSADIIISISSKYLDELNNENLCQIISDARKNNDLSTETKLSKISLAWRFKNMFKYKDCLGI